MYTSGSSGIDSITGGTRSAAAVSSTADSTETDAQATARQVTGTTRMQEPIARRNAARKRGKNRMSGGKHFAIVLIELLYTICPIYSQREFDVTLFHR